MTNLQYTSVIVLAFSADRRNALKLVFISCLSVSVSSFAPLACGVFFILGQMSKHL